MVRFTSTFSLPSTIPTTEGSQIHLNILLAQYYSKKLIVVRYTSTLYMAVTCPTTEGDQVHLNLLFDQYYHQQQRVVRFTSTFYWTSTILNNKGWSGTPQPSLCPVLSPTTEGSQVHLNLLLAQYYPQQPRVVRFTSTFSLPSTIPNN